MGTEVLRPQDCLVERFPVTFHGRKNYLPSGYYAKSYRKPTVVRTDPRKKSTNHHQQHQQQQNQEVAKLKTRDDVKVTRVNNNNGPVAVSNGPGPVMGKVTILRRGVSMDSLNPKIKKDNTITTTTTTKREDDLVTFGTERLGPEQPGMLPMFGNPVDVYAGSAFSVSPCPSSLPLPSFFRKQEFKSFEDDSATRGLRRLLRLE